jgi:acyl-CoA synthetase (AMP-forming)/AMP-acid ligase II
LQYTGGTTGLPKGAMVSHYTLTLASLGSHYWFHNKQDDVFLGVTPFFHIMGMVQMMCAPLLSGGKVVVLSRFLPEVVVRAIVHYKCTAWVGATTMLIALLQVPEIRKYNLGSFRYICSGGSPVTVEIQEKVKELAPHALIVDGYGLTESVSQGGAITPLGRYKPGFVGVPHLSDIKIVDLESGLKELPPGEDGEILLKGPAIMKGYWNKPEETEKALKDGWLYTGDIGSMDEEGYLKFSGRKKELIKCSGYSVFPSEVEELFYRHPAVAEVAVIGIPDPYRGESPKAFIVLKSDYKGKVKEEEIMNWCKENMAAYKRPRLIEFRDELPKSGAGKVLRRILAGEEKNRQEE